MSEELFAAIDAGDVQRVGSLVQAAPARAGARDAQGVSAVLHARYRNRFDVVDVLLAAEPNRDLDVFDAAGLGLVERLEAILDSDPEAVDAVSGDGFTPLHLASFFGHPTAVRLLLDRGAPVGAVSSNAMELQPLHSAVAGGHAEVVDLLLDAGADADARQEGGWTPLMAAAASGNEPALEALLLHGADPDARLDDGRNAVDLAVERGHPDLAERLRSLLSGA